MKPYIMDERSREREHNISLAEYQAYIIDGLINEFDEAVKFWLADAEDARFNFEADIWPDVGAFERQLYIASLVDSAREVVRSHF